MIEFITGGLMVGSLVWIVRGRRVPVRFPRRSGKLDNTGLTFLLRGRR